MINKIIVVFGYQIRKFPPVISLVRSLIDLGYDVVLITRHYNYDKDTIYPNTKKLININIEELNIDNGIINNLLKSTLGKRRLGKFIWKSIDKHYNDNSLLWIISEVTVLLLGKKLLNYRYYLHMLELSEQWKRFSKISKLTINPKIYYDRAIKVIDVEYNRAHILKAWFDLEKIPEVLPNKPYNMEIYKRNAQITSSIHADVINKLKNKKIILYQGGVNKERPLKPIIDAVNELGYNYAVVVMSADENMYKEIESDNFFYLPFVTPPQHLEITSHAFIGILSYVPVKSSGYSVLDYIYCAPNKIFEYSMFGIPMIGNNIPGLYFPFELYNCGFCAENWNKYEIKELIKLIEKNYNQMSKGALDYYNSFDINKIVKSILTISDKDLI